MLHIHKEIEKIKDEASFQMFTRLNKLQPIEIPIEVQVSGISFRNLIDDAHIDLLFRILDKLSLQENCKIILRKGFTRPCLTYIPVIIVNNSSEEINFFNYINVDDSYVGAFQAYLLYNLWRQLPLSDAALSESRYYLYCPNDVSIITKQLEECIEEDKVLFDGLSDDYSNDFEKIIEQLDNADISISINGMKGLYFISYCYWTFGEGLSRIFCEIHIENNKITYIKEFCHQRIIQCGSDKQSHE